MEFGLNVFDNKQIVLSTGKLKDGAICTFLWHRKYFFCWHIFCKDQSPGSFWVVMLYEFKYDH